jgi:hypothetical protein
MARKPTCSCHGVREGSAAVGDRVLSDFIVTCPRTHRLPPGTIKLLVICPACSVPSHVGKISIVKRRRFVLAAMTRMLGRLMAIHGS